MKDLTFVIAAPCLIAKTLFLKLMSFSGSMIQDVRAIQLR
jgi:hypothetical protein